MVFEGDSLKDYRLDFKDNKLVKVELPNVNERKVGKWIRVGSGSFIDDFRCSCCNKHPLLKKVGYAWGWDFTDYCPYCGADMRGNENG